LINILCYNYYNINLKNNPMKLERITVNSEVMGGKSCIRGLRVTVGTIVGLVAAGHSFDTILEAYPYLEKEDILAALSYAAWRSEEYEINLATA
jgi:uncharacterized protein (DUF433 family)